VPHTWVAYFRRYLMSMARRWGPGRGTAKRPKMLPQSLTGLRVPGQLTGAGGAHNGPQPSGPIALPIRTFETSCMRNHFLHGLVALRCGRDTALYPTSAALATSAFPSFFFLYNSHLRLRPCVFFPKATIID
jgi:hypothetical protein